MDRPVQMIETSPDSIPFIMSGVRNYTIRWSMPSLKKGILVYFNECEPSEQIPVWVTHIEKMPLASVPTYLGKEGSWPLQKILEDMRKYYPKITLSDLVDVVVHLTPRESLMRISYMIRHKKMH